MIFSSKPSNSARVGARFLEVRFSLGTPIDPIEHQTMQMDVQIGGGAKTLDEGDRAGVGCTASQSRLFEQKSRDDPVDDAQHRREQLGMSGEQNAQRNRK